MLPYYAITPLEGIKAKAKDVKYSIGAIGYKKLPYLTSLTKTKDGKKGLTLKVFLEPSSDPNRKQIDEILTEQGEMFLVDYKHPKIKSNLFYVDVEGTFTPEESGEYEFSLAVAGTGKLYVDGKEVVDNETSQTAGDSFFGAGTGEVFGSIHLEAGKSYDIVTKFATLPTMKIRTRGATMMGAGGLRLGVAKKHDSKIELEKAVKLAKDVDQVIICAGLNVSF